MSTTPRVFYLQRNKDVTGVSGTGIVAWGVEFPDGRVATRWRGEYPCTAAWDDLEQMLAVHGHNGATVAIWLDEAPPETMWGLL